MQPRDVTLERDPRLRRCLPVRTDRRPSTDDDGGSDEDTAAVVITGNATESKGQGWWKNQYRVKSSNDFTPAQLDCYLADRPLLQPRLRQRLPGRPGGRREDPPEPGEVTGVRDLRSVRHRRLAELRQRLGEPRHTGRYGRQQRTPTRRSAPPCSRPSRSGSTRHRPAHRSRHRRTSWSASPPRVAIDVDAMVARPCTRRLAGRVPGRDSRVLGRTFRRSIGLSVSDDEPARR